MRGFEWFLTATALVSLTAPAIAHELGGQEAAIADHPDPPPIVAERITDGRFEPGDFEYLRGYFPGADARETARYRQMTDWLEQCREVGKARLAAQLAAAGLTLEDDRYTISSPSLCTQVFRGEQFKQFETFDQLQNAAREARLVFATLIESIRLVEQRVGPITPNFARELETRILGEQLLRLSYNWGATTGDNPRIPQMSDDAKIVFKTFVTGEIGPIDRANTLWLKRHVHENGWPLLSEVGEKASNAAWLLVQHADHDPVFQFDALKLMEPLVAEGEVSKGNFAYLYDRIMLKLNGEQRYATQMSCRDGAYVPQPLEEAGRVDELRAEMELDPLSEYLTNFPASC